MATPRVMRLEATPAVRVTVTDKNQHPAHSRPGQMVLNPGLPLGSNNDAVRTLRHRIRLIRDSSTNRRAEFRRLQQVHTRLAARRVHW